MFSSSLKLSLYKPIQRGFSSRINCGSCGGLSLDLSNTIQCRSRSTVRIPKGQFLEPSNWYNSALKLNYRLRYPASLKSLTPSFSSSTRSHFIFRGMGDMMSQEVPGLENTTAEERPGKIKLTDAEWKAKLSPQEYRVCRNHGTERAWTGDLLYNKDKGVYTCSCCGTELFKSNTKFDSGSGWPSFSDVMKDKDISRLPAVDIKQDGSHGMVRTEVLCGKCSAHLGHVFNDGPKPTGLRYCINSVSLKFKAENAENGAGSSNNNKNNL